MSNAKTICTVCNYIYEESAGEPRQEIAPGCRFEDLGDQWRCPECNSSKDMFQPCSCVSLSVYEQTCVPHRGGKEHRAVVNDFTEEITVGELVAKYPYCACVFEQYGIDYCCGGKVSLKEACRQKAVALEELLEKINNAAQKNDRNIETIETIEKDWQRTTLKELTEHIVQYYHNPLRLELSRILPLAEKVARVHGEKHPQMIEVQAIFQSFKEQLELHMQKEELILFPTIDAIESKQNKVFGCGGGLEHPIAVMSGEHDQAGEALCAMRRLTNSYTPPNDACTTFKLLLSSLAQLESEMHQHVHKENNILFPRALKMLGATPGNAPIAPQSVR